MEEGEEAFELVHPGICDDGTPPLVSDVYLRVQEAAEKVRAAEKEFSECSDRHAYLQMAAAAAAAVAAAAAAARLSEQYVKSVEAFKVLMEARNHLQKAKAGLPIAMAPQKGAEATSVPKLLMYDFMISDEGRQGRVAYEGLAGEARGIAAVCSATNGRDSSE